MAKIKLHRYVVLATLLLVSPTRHQDILQSAMLNNYLPDLKIKKVHFQYHRHESSPEPGKPIRPIVFPPYEIEFNLYISNIGTDDWNHDLYIQYEFDGKPLVKHEPKIIDSLLIPFSTNTDVIIKIDYPSTKPDFITFCLNTTKIDSIDYYKIYDELYYRNNVYKVKLN
jgi:hypothetical protein